MITDTTYQLNPLGHEKTFEVSAFVGAFDFGFNPIPQPYLEKYNFSQIIFAAEGEGVYYTEDATYAIRPGTMFYRPADRTSQYYMVGERVHLTVISFVCASPAAMVFAGEPIALGEEEQDALLDLIRTASRVCEPIREGEPLRGMRYRSETPGVVLDFIRSSLERFLCMVYCRLRGIGFLCDETEKVSAKLDASSLSERIKGYLREHLSEPLTVAQICAHFGMSQTGLMRKFRRECGSGLMEYFNDLKISEAKHLIAKTSQSFNEIADALGFSSPNYFSKVFKAKVGMTPTEYSKFVSKRRALGVRV